MGPIAEHWVSALGWGGSALLVFSLLQARVLRFRVLNLTACVVLTCFNALLSVWPMVAMNVVLCAINVWFISRLLRDRHDEARFAVLRVQPEDAYLRHVLSTYRDDIATTQPDFDGSTDQRVPFLVQKGDETVGVVLLEVRDRVARVVLDWVTERYRDHSPGEFVWREAGLLDRLVVDRVETSHAMVGAYYDKVGFRSSGDRFVLERTDPAGTGPA